MTSLHHGLGKDKISTLMEKEQQSPKTQNPKFSVFLEISYYFLLNSDCCINFYNELSHNKIYSKFNPRS